MASYFSLTLNNDGFSNSIQLGTEELVIGSSGFRGDISTRDKRSAHKEAAAQFFEKMLRQGNKGLVTGVEHHHIAVTNGSGIICRKIVTTFIATKKDIPFEAISDLNEMQVVNGLEMGGRSYEDSLDGAVLRHETWFWQDGAKAPSAWVPWWTPRHVDSKE